MLLLKGKYTAPYQNHVLAQVYSVHRVGDEYVRGAEGQGGSCTDHSARTPGGPSPTTMSD